MGTEVDRQVEREGAQGITRKEKNTRRPHKERRKSKKRGTKRCEEQKKQRCN